MLYAIETNNKTVALTERDDVVECLNNDGYLRDTVRLLKRGSALLWNGVTPFTSRPATETEQAAYKHWQAGRAC